MRLVSHKRSRELQAVGQLEQQVVGVRLRLQTKGKRMNRTQRNEWNRHRRLLVRRGIEERHALAAAERNRVRRAKQEKKLQTKGGL